MENDAAIIAYNIIHEKLEQIEHELSVENLQDSVKDSLLAWKDLLVYARTIVHQKRFPHLPSNSLDDLNNALRQININVLRNCSAYISYYHSVMGALNRIPVIVNKRDFQFNFTEWIKSFNEKTESAINNFQANQKQLLADWEERKDVISNEIKQIREEDITTLGEEIEKLNESIEARKAENQQVISTFRSEFNSFQEARKNDMNALQTNFVSDTKQLIADYTTEADKTLSHLQMRKDEVEKLWGIIGSDVASGEAKSYADKAKGMADLLMWIALGFLCVITLTITIITLIDIYKGSFSFVTFFYKVIASSVLLAPSFYCMNLAKRQRDREFQLRDFEVKTSALEPFMERMRFSVGQKSKKDETKLELAKTFFDKEFAKANKQHADILLSSDMLKGMEEFGKIFHQQKCEDKK